jgi:hypothetical protein
MSDPIRDPDDFGDDLSMLHIGIVKNTKDPKGIGRVRIKIPGLTELTGWARPLGTLLGASPQRGMHFIPNEGATVGVLFHLADIDSPYYLAGAPGAAVPDVGEEVPSFVKEQPVEDRDKLRVIETDFFVIAIDDRPTHVLADGETPDVDTNLEDPRQRLVILFKGDDDLPTTADYIEIDGVSRAIQVSATSAVRLASSGLIELDANQIQFTIQGVTRRVSAITKDI